MKIMINRDDLIDALELPQSITEKKTISSNPNTTQILINFEKEKTTFTGTNMDVYIKSEIKIPCEEEQTVSVNAKNFYELIKEFPEDMITLQIDNDQITLNNETSKYTFVTSDTENFPEIPNIENSKKIEIKSENMLKLLDTVSYAASNEDIRPSLKGIFMELEENSLIGVATDSHRLSFIKMKFENINETNFPQQGLIIPKKATGEIKKICLKGDSIYFETSDTDIKISNENTELIVRQVMGKYPQYRDIIPNNYPISFSIDRKEFVHSTKRAAIFSQEHTRGIKMSVEEDKIFLTCRNEIGESLEELDIKLNGTPVSIGFNIDFLLETVSSFNSEKLQFELKDEMSAAIIRPEGEEDIFAIIMPMTINW